MKLYSLKIISASFVLVTLFWGCGENPLNQGAADPVVFMRSDLDAKAYPSSNGGLADGNPTSTGAIVDSLEVTSASILVSDLKLHGFDNGDSIEQFGTIRSGEFLVVFDSMGTNYIAESNVLAGTYPRLKFEVHPLHGNIDSLIAIDIHFAQFVTSGTTNTVIIHGYTYRDGVRIPFVFTSGFVMNGQFFFDTPLTLEAGMRQELRMRFLSQAAFSAEGSVLDPSDIRNRSTIENNLRSSVGIFRL